MRWCAVLMVLLAGGCAKEADSGSRSPVVVRDAAPSPKQQIRTELANARRALESGDVGMAEELLAGLPSDMETPEIRALWRSVHSAGLDVCFSAGNLTCAADRIKGLQAVGAPEPELAEPRNRLGEASRVRIEELWKTARGSGNTEAKLEAARELDRTCARLEDVGVAGGGGCATQRNQIQRTLKRLEARAQREAERRRAREEARRKAGERRLARKRAKEERRRAREQAREERRRRAEERGPSPLL